MWTKSQFTVYSEVWVAAFAIKSPILCKILHFSKISALMTMLVEATTTESILATTGGSTHWRTYSNSPEVIEVIETTTIVRSYPGSKVLETVRSLER